MSGVGLIVVPSDDPMQPNMPVWYGRPGSAASTAEGMGGEIIDIPARGDPSLYYVHIRTHEALTVDMPLFGPRATPADESAAVLGVWSGDEPP